MIALPLQLPNDLTGDLVKAAPTALDLRRRVKCLRRSDQRRGDVLLSSRFAAHVARQSVEGSA